MLPTIFVSYNPGVEVEQSTALRLQTIASLYNATVLLPDRLGTTQLKSSTKERIREANVFVMFSTSKLSKAVSDEARHAISVGKRVIIFYSKHTGKNLDIDHKQGNFFEVTFDPRYNSADQLLHAVLENGGFVKEEPKTTSPHLANFAIGALVGVGLGMLLMNAFSEDDAPKKKKTSRR